MPSLLQLDSSIDPVASVSRRLTTLFADAWRARGPEYTVVARDLVADPVPHLPHASLHWPERLRGVDAPSLPAEDAVQQAVLDQLFAADVLLVAAPMYNYTVPSTLKTWLDHIHLPGVTTPFDVEVQPLRGRPAVIVSSRGAIYDEGTPEAAWDHAVPPVRLILGEKLGMDVHVVTVSRTLASTVSTMAGELGRFEDELAAAESTLAELARTLG